MPFYQKRGTIPNKRHIQFRNKSGDLYSEELISRKGFSHIYSNVYHLNPPTAIRSIGEFKNIKHKPISDVHRPHHIKTENLILKGDAISSRASLFFNNDLILSKAHVSESMDSLYRNGNADEVLFIHSGSGTFESNLGNLELKHGDYLVIPRGVIWKISVTNIMKMFIIRIYLKIKKTK